MIILEKTCAGDCGSITVYDVDFKAEMAREKIRVPWNKAALNGFKSEKAAVFHLRDVDGEYGTIPDHFEILPPA